MESGNELTAHLTSSAVVVYGIEWLKSSGWCPWITADTRTVNRIMSGIAAAAMAFGISWTYDPAVGGDIHIPMLSILIGGGYDWLKQFVMQQVIWDGVLAPKKG